MSKTYYIETYGCQMNEYDSALVESLLETEGYAKSPVPEGADVVLVNTCSVREKAEDTAYEKLRNLQALKKAKPGMKLGMIGCMAENKRETIFERLPKLDLAIGPDHYESLPELLGISGRTARVGTSREGGSYEGAYAQAASGVLAHVAVQRGCNFHCAYCIVPSTRGPEKSRSLRDVVEEVRRLAAKGIREVNLLGQTVNAYRAQDGSWTDLLAAVSEIDGIERIRYTSPHPRYYTRAAVEAQARLPKVMPHAHIPVQSGSTPVLKAMRRQYSREQYLDTIARLRETVPGIALTTDIIAGFPGETREDHEATLSLMEAVRFDQAFMFAYSPRPGTPSASMEEFLTAQEKQARLAEIIDLQHRHTRERLEEQVGKIEPVLLEGPSRREPSVWFGKTPHFRKVVVEPGEGAEPGQILSVKIEARRGTVLRGVRA